MIGGWHVRKIGEVCDLATGGTPSTAKPEFFGGNTRWLVSGDIHRREIIDCEGRITEAGMKASNAKLLPINSVMIALNGQGKTRGTVALLRTLAACNQSLVSITPRASSGLLPEFLFANLSGRYEEIRRLTSDADNDRRGLNMGMIREITVPIAPIAEQRRIVAILDKAFEGISTAKANAEKNLQNARALYAGHLEIVFSRRNEGCVERRLSDVAREFGRGKSRHRPRNEPALYGGPYPFVQTGDISGADHWLNDFTQTYSELGLAQSRIWPSGTVCIAIVGATVGETAILSFDACFPDSVIGIVVDSNAGDPEYVEYMLQSFKALLKEKGQGTARDNINLGTFENQLFPFPSLLRQQEIVATLNNLRDEVRRLEAIVERKLAALDELKKSLLHQAFSGGLSASKATDCLLQAA